MPAIVKQFWVEKIAALRAVIPPGADPSWPITIDAGTLRRIADGLEHLFLEDRPPDPRSIPTPPRSHPKFPAISSREPGVVATGGDDDELPGFHDSDGQAQAAVLTAVATRQATTRQSPEPNRKEG